MTTAREYTEKVRSLNRAGLIDLWRQIEQHQTPGWADGMAFQYLIIRAFELEGHEVRFPYRVQWPGDGTVIEEIDGTVYVGGVACLIESKDGGTQDIGPIAKMRNQLLRRPNGAIGSIFSRQGFTSPARLLASFAVSQTILLWDGAEVEACLSKESFGDVLLEKYHKAIEEGIPDFNEYEKAVER